MVTSDEISKMLSEKKNTENERIEVGSKGNYCTSCGTENQENAKFCIKCGNDLSSDSNYKECPNCGTDNSKEADFCQECGKNLKPTSKAKKSMVKNSDDINIMKAQEKHSKDIKQGIFVIVAFFFIMGVLGYIIFMITLGF